MTRPMFFATIAAFFGVKASAQPRIDFSSDVSFAQSFSGKDWADAFVEYVKTNPLIATDAETMHTWFASAIMRGYDERDRRLDKEVRAAGKSIEYTLEKKALLGAIARGWCAEKNSHKQMDCNLAEAIADEVLALRSIPHQDAE
jgi:hypothetical protein